LTPVCQLTSTGSMTTIRSGNSHNIPNFLRKDVKRAACLSIMLDERCTTLGWVPLHFLLYDQNSTQIIIKAFYSPTNAQVIVLKTIL